MILPGATVFSRGILKGLVSSTQQVQPCGVDLSLRRVLRWTDAGIIDFDNTHRKTATTLEIPWSGGNNIHLGLGAYLVEFNEKEETPLDAMGQVFVRSSLFRSGATVNAGVMDSGYAGAIGAMLQVHNPHGLLVYRDAKLAQLVFYEMKEEVKGYSGIYQKSSNM